MDKLKLVLLWGNSPRHIYVANKLCAACDVVAIVQESATEWNARKFRKVLRPANLTRKAWRWLRDRVRYSTNSEAEFFFPGDVPRLNRPEIVTTVPHINHPRVVDLVEELKPDLVAVFGTSLIKGNLLGKGRLGMVNLHGGLSPEYRGADCTFWALYNQEPEKVGCTLHYIDAGIDTGRMIAHVCPPVFNNDNELTLFWRAVKESAPVYAELVEKLATGELPGKSQLSKGRLYQVKERGYRHERRVGRYLNDGMLGGLTLGLRVKWF